MTDEYADQDPDQGSSQGEKTFTQTQLDKIIANRLPEYENLRSKADQFDQLTQSTEETLASVRAQAEAAEAELAWRDVLLTRQQVAAKKGLDPELWDRIQGETPEEIEADIGKLVGFTGPAATRNSGRSPVAAGFSSGASSGKQQTDKERAAEALRGLRER
jgi:septal ring factor EnvC (AmiA/AmiB activator)